MRVRGSLWLALSILAAACATPDGTAPGTSLRPSAAAPASSPAAGPLGSWAMTLTEADLRGAGFTDAGLIGENTGTFTLTLAEDGTWTMAQSTDRPIRWPVFRGTWTMPAPGSVEMRTEFPQDYAGEVVTVRWSVGPEGLRLEVMSPPDPLIKAQLETHPWARSP